MTVKGYDGKISSLPKAVSENAAQVIEKIVNFPQNYASKKQAEADAIVAYAKNKILSELDEKILDSAKAEEQNRHNDRIMMRWSERLAEYQRKTSQVAAKKFADYMRSIATPQNTLTKVKEFPNGDVAFSHGFNYGIIDQNGEMYLIDGMQNEFEDITKKNARLFAWAGDVLRHAEERNVETDPKSILTHSSWFDAMKTVGIDTKYLPKND